MARDGRVWWEAVKSQVSAEKYVMFVDLHAKIDCYLTSLHIVSSEAKGLTGYCFKYI